MSTPRRSAPASWQVTDCRRSASLGQALDLQHPDKAYLFGFLLGDDTLFKGRGRKGRLSIEVAARDEEHLQALSFLLPGPLLSAGVRRTNFSGECRTCVLAWCREEVRQAVAAAQAPRRLGWDHEQDARALGAGPVAQIAAEMSRSVSSVVTRRWRLRTLYSHDGSPG